MLKYDLKMLFVFSLKFIQTKILLGFILVVWYLIVLLFFSD